MSTILEENAEFYQRHKAELDKTATALRLTAVSFLCLAGAGVLQQAWEAGGGLFLPTSNLDQIAFGCFLLHAGASDRAPSAACLPAPPTPRCSRPDICVWDYDAGAARPECTY